MNLFLAGSVADPYQDANPDQDDSALEPECRH